MASIETLKSNIASGFAKANRFEVQLPPLNSIPKITTSSIIDFITGEQNISFDLGGVIDTVADVVPEFLIDAALQRVGIERTAIPPQDLGAALGLPFGPRIDLDESRRTSLFCTSVNMPGRQMTTTDRSIGMVTQAMPYLSLIHI